MSKIQVVCRSYPQIDGMEKATGRTRFASDIKLAGMLHARVLRSPYPHARILNIDTSRAKALPGVKAVVAYSDTPGVKFGPRTDDWTIFADDKVRFCGDEVAAVAAVDEDTAEEALGLIRVEHEELPFVESPLEALKPGAPLVHEDHPGNVVAEFKVEAGDVDRALANSHVVCEERFYTNQTYQACLEPMGAVADIDLAGRITLYAGNQIPSMIRVPYAKALGLSLDQVRVMVPDFGGAFGAKMETNTHLIAMLLAQKTGKPVRHFNTRHDDFIAGNPRVPMYIDIKLGADKEGVVTGKEVKVIGDAGARVVYSQIIVATACYRVDSLYGFKNVRAKGITAYTNTVPTSCFRGFGNTQATFVLESAMDILAHKLGMDPAEMRIKNSIGPNSVSVHGWKINSCGLKECVEEATNMSGWAEKRAKKRPLKGIGLSCCNHVSGNRAFAREFDGGAGIVRIGRDGRITVYHGESDMGQGQKTVYAQIAAETLGVPLDWVSVMQVDTDISPWGFGRFATQGALMGGDGVLAASKDAFTKLAQVAADMLESNVDDVVCEGGRFHVKGSPDKSLDFKEVALNATDSNHGSPVMGTGFYDPPTVLPDPKTKQGNISPAYPFGCQIAEVEVDPTTGKVTVTNFVAAHDVGRAINPMALEGQIQGGVAQGLGWTLMENMVTDKGRVANANFLDYWIPTALDMPPVEPKLIEPYEPNGPYGAKGIGEPAINPTMSAITNAIFNATGVRITELPVSPEKLLAEMERLKGTNEG